MTLFHDSNSNVEDDSLFHTVSNSLDTFATIDHNVMDNYTDTNIHMRGDPMLFSPLDNHHQNYLTRNMQEHMTQHSSASLTPSIATTNHSGPKVNMCRNCGVTETPLWRRSPDGNDVLCNACGLYLKANSMHRPISDTSSIRSDSNDSTKKKRRVEPRKDIQCVNCTSSETPLWRRNENGEPLCNACGLYWKFHGYHKAVSSTRSSNNNINTITEVNEMQLSMQSNAKVQEFARSFGLSNVMKANSNIASVCKCSIQTHQLGLIRLQKSLEYLKAIRNNGDFEDYEMLLAGSNWEDVKMSLSQLKKQLNDFVDVIDSINE